LPTMARIYPFLRMHLPLGRPQRKIQKLGRKNHLKAGRTHHPTEGRNHPTLGRLNHPSLTG
jgi:hypothetical protein